MGSIVLENKNKGNAVHVQEDLVALHLSSKVIAMCSMRDFVVLRW